MRVAVLVRSALMIRSADRPRTARIQEMTMRPAVRMSVSMAAVAVEGYLSHVANDRAARGATAVVRQDSRAKPVA
jgi:hypothetical protein